MYASSSSSSSSSSPMLLGGVPALPFRGNRARSKRVLKSSFHDGCEFSSSSRVSSSSSSNFSMKKSKRGGRARGRGEMMRVNALFGGKGKAETSKDTSTSKSPATKEFSSGDKKQKQKSPSSSAGQSGTKSTGKKKTSSSSTSTSMSSSSPKKRTTKGETVLTDPSFGGVRWYQKQKKKAYEYWRARSDRAHLQIGSWGQNAKMPRYLPHSSYVPGDASSNPYLRNKDKLSIEDLKFTQWDAR